MPLLLRGTRVGEVGGALRLLARTGLGEIRPPLAWRLAAFGMAIGLLWTVPSSAAAEAEPPHLAKKGNATQLIVQGQPWIMLAGELHNSSASGVEYLRRMWPKLGLLKLNTVLAPVSWELLEPAEGQFDFTLVDALLALAREHHQRLVLLWFGSWKNGVSSYAPGWVLRDTNRFPRAKGSSNQNTKDILSTLSSNNLTADARAFTQLMRHLRQADAREQTVIMIQVENEVGIKPELRDLSELGNQAYAAAVPGPLLEYLNEHKELLPLALSKRWATSNFAMEGNWPQVFGDEPETAELFSAWYYAHYIEQVAAAGQAEYPLPMYCNAWLASKLGTYPCGGPVAHVHDIWRAAAPHIAVLAPDIYVGEFKQVNAEYATHGNPLFVPEASRDPDCAARVFWTIAQHQGLGFSPFGIESLPEDHPLRESYDLLRQLTPAITAAHGSGRMLGIYRQGSEDDPPPADLGDCRVEVHYEKRLPPAHRPVGGLVIRSGDEEFLVAGYGFNVQFHATAPGPRSTHILSVEWGHFDERGTWVHDLWLNGDETGGNGAARIPPFPGNEFLGNNRALILRVKVYRYE